MCLGPETLHPALNPSLDPALCRSVCYRSDAAPLWLNLPPTIAPQAGILKAGAAGIECPLEAKHVLALVMIDAAAAQRFTFSESLSLRRS